MNYQYLYVCAFLACKPSFITVQCINIYVLFNMETYFFSTTCDTIPLKRPLQSVTGILNAL